MLKKFINWTKTPSLVINREDGPYLHRYHLFPKNKWFNIYLHHFLGDDVREACHDHPWHSLGIILEGSYKEITPRGVEIFNAGKIKYRGPDYYHRIELFQELYCNYCHKWYKDFTKNKCTCGQTLFYKTKPVWTLFITGPVIKDWHFLCPKGPVSHKEVIKIRTSSLHEGIQCPD